MLDNGLTDQVNVYHTNAPFLSHKRELGVTLRKAYIVQNEGCEIVCTLVPCMNVSLNISKPQLNWITDECEDIEHFVSYPLPLTHDKTKPISMRRTQ